MEDPAVIYVGECFAYALLKEFYSFWSYIRSLIHFEFVFVYGVRNCSSFIVLQVVDQFSQQHLLKRLSNKVPFHASQNGCYPKDYKQ